MAIHWLTTAMSAERVSAIFNTRTAKTQSLNTRGFSLGVMWLEYKADYSPVYSNDSENAWCSLPLPLMPDVFSPESSSPPNQSTLSSRSTLILSVYLHIGFPSSLFSSDVTTKLSTHLSPIHSTWPNPTHPPLFHQPHNISQAVQVTNILKWCSCLHSPPSASLLCPNTVAYATTNHATRNSFWQ